MTKLRKNETLDGLGLLKTGKRIGEKPLKERELVLKTGTRAECTKEAFEHWKKYAPHNYERKWDAATMNGLRGCLLPTDVLLESDFSAHPQLRSTMELTCQSGKRVSLFTSVASYGISFKEYAIENWVTSFLIWSDDNSQDPVTVNAYRTEQLARLFRQSPEKAKLWTRVYEATDKCPSQFWSKSAARECCEWIQTAPGEISTLIRVMHVTAHGCYAGDGEGGADKRAVDSFIRNEESWQSSWSQDTHTKPVVNDAKTAALVAQAIRGVTAFEKQKKAGGSPENKTGTINQRIHIGFDNELDHDPLKYAAKPINRFKGWYVWRFEKGEKSIMYRRKRMCVCVSCIESKWENCSLKNLVGGPGPWEMVQLEFLDRKDAAEMRQARSVSAADFRRGLRVICEHLCVQRQLPRLTVHIFCFCKSDKHFCCCPVGRGALELRVWTSED